VGDYPKRRATGVCQTRCKGTGQRDDALALSRAAATARAHIGASTEPDLGARIWACVQIIDDVRPSGSRFEFGTYSASSGAQLNVSMTCVSRPLIGSLRAGQNPAAELASPLGRITLTAEVAFRWFWRVRNGERPGSCSVEVRGSYSTVAQLAESGKPWRGGTN
jgi:hypothetical protein